MDYGSVTCLTCLRCFLWILGSEKLDSVCKKIALASQESSQSEFWKDAQMRPSIQRVSHDFIQMKPIFLHLTLMASTSIETFVFCSVIVFSDIEPMTCVRIMQYNTNGAKRRILLF